MQRNKTVIWCQVTGYRVAVLDWVVREGHSEVTFRLWLEWQKGASHVKDQEQEPFKQREQQVQKASRWDELGKVKEWKLSVTGASLATEWVIAN